MTTNSYTVAEVEDRGSWPVACEDCGWEGAAGDVEDIGKCALTPGDPSPVGRCPECGTICYVQHTKYEAAMALVAELAAIDFNQHNALDPRYISFFVGAAQHIVNAKGPVKVEGVPAVSDSEINRTVAYVAAARAGLGSLEGDLEVDENAIVSRADDNPDGGAYVQAWLWVSDEEAGIESSAASAAGAGSA